MAAACLEDRRNGPDFSRDKLYDPNTLYTKDRLA